MARLRQETTVAHMATETAVDITAHLQSADVYRGLLLRFYGFYAPLSTVFNRFAFDAGSAFENPAAPRAAWLEQDLATLGFDKAHIAGAARCTELPRLADMDEALGALYVIEGSSLGGNIIAKQVSRTLSLDAGNGARFFNGYGEETGPRWKAFSQAMNDYGRTTPAPGNVVEGARDTFTQLGRWMKRSFA